MISYQLIKISSTGNFCAHRDCKHLPEYFDKILNSYYLKLGQTCLWVGLPNRGGELVYEFYCRDCIDMLYKYLKPILDSKLWALT